MSVFSNDLPDPDEGGLADKVAATVRYEAAMRELRQQDLAEILSISRSAVSLRYRGKAPWTLNEIGRLAVAFGMHPGELLSAPRRQPRLPPAW